MDDLTLTLVLGHNFGGHLGCGPAPATTPTTGGRAIDAQAREQNLDMTERDWLRQQMARSILESIKSQIEMAKSQTLPKSALAKATNLQP